MITVFGDNACDDLVTFCFTQHSDFLGDLTELVRIKAMKWSPYLATMHVTIWSLFVSTASGALVVVVVWDISIQLPSFGNFSQLLASFGNFWLFLATFGNFHELSWTFCHFTQLLVTFWQSLAIFDNVNYFWQSLATLGILLATCDLFYSNHLVIRSSFHLSVW